MTAQTSQRALTGVSRLALADLERLLLGLAGLPADEVRDVLLEAVPELGAKWGDAAATAAADFYEEQRAAAGITSTFYADLATLAAGDRLDALVRWSVGPLYAADTAAPDFTAAAKRLDGGFQRVVANAYRDTITTNVARDRRAVGWARHASANACAFCALLATRGAVYKSEADAMTVTGHHLGGSDYRAMRLGSTREARLAGRASRAGLKRSIGSKYHDHCHCTAVPIFSGQEYEEAPYVAKFREAYAEAGNSSDLHAALAGMREQGMR